MRKLLLDTNIVIDALAHRVPFNEKAELLLMLGKLGEFELYISSSQITDVYYVLSDGGKKSLAEQTKARLGGLRKGLRISALTEDDIDEAIRSTWPDFEDACVYQAARRVKAEAIITRNQADFDKSFVPVLDCDELFAKISEEEGIDYALIDF